MYKTTSEGSMKDPLLETVEGRFGHIIKPGDFVITFTQANRATRIDAGIFCGVIREKIASIHGTRDWTYYVVQRQCGKRTKLNYNGMVPGDMKLSELVGETV